MAAFRNIEESLSKHLPTDELIEVKKILYGRADEWVEYFILCAVAFQIHYFQSNKMQN